MTTGDKIKVFGGGGLGEGAFFKKNPPPEKNQPKIKKGNDKC
jgi:hypothetical protein